MASDPTLSLQNDVYIVVCNNMCMYMYIYIAKSTDKVRVQRNSPYLDCNSLAINCLNPKNTGNPQRGWYSMQFITEVSSIWLANDYGKLPWQIPKHDVSLPNQPAGTPKQ